MHRDEDIPDAADLLGDLTPDQRAAVTSDASPLCILASAGAGKTRVLTRRIAYRCRTGRADAEHTLALTFTRKAAGELKDRLGSLGLRGGVAAGTFHAQAAAQLQLWWADRRRPVPALLDRKSRLLGPIVAGRPGLESAPLAEIASAIEWAQARALDPEGLGAAVDSGRRRVPPGVTGAALTAVFRRYEDEKRRRGLVDFDDLLARCAAAIETDPEFGQAQRWRWRHVYVDEFQDLNPLQFRLLRAWLGTSEDLCVVGDPNQAIYGWNGADPSILGGLPETWPATQVLRLDANHRCTDQIVTVAASVLGPAGSSLVGSGRSGPAPVVSSYASDADEADAIAGQITLAHAGGREWSSMAVLARTNAQLSVIQAALTRAGVPSWAAVPTGALDDPAVQSILASVREREHQPLVTVLADLGEIGAGEPDRAAALASLGDTARAFLVLAPDARAGEWLRWLPAAGRGAGDGFGGAGVALASFHRAKGLEWPEVWVAGVEEGLVPMSRATTAPAEAEERQLLYVALTRAEHDLHVSWARNRVFRAHPVPRQPSRWLAEIEAAIETLTANPSETLGAVDVARWRHRLAEQKAALKRSSTPPCGPNGHRVPTGWPAPDGEVRERVRDWRMRAARHSGVPPHAVLHDAVVEAVASLRPGSIEELLRVPGFGPVKASRYGSALLEAVSGAPPAAVPA